MLKEVLNTVHSELSSNEATIKLYYISELLRLDKEFDVVVRKAMLKSIKRGNTPSKRVVFSEFSENEILDITNQIE